MNGLAWCLLSDFQNTFRYFLNELRLENLLPLHGNVNLVDGETFRLGHRFYSVDRAPSGAPGGGGRILGMKRSIAKAIPQAGREGHIRHGVLRGNSSFDWRDGSSEERLS